MTKAVAIKTARVQGGAAYSGHTAFLGNGLLRSCGKCGVHRPQGGGSKHRLLGWVGACCAPKAGA